MKKPLLFLVLSFFYVFGDNEKQIDTLPLQSIQLQESIKRGKNIYQKKCARCHKDNGEGKLKKYPPLAASDFLRGKREESIRTIKFGLKGELIVNNILYDKKMPKSRLKNNQIADVMNYISNSWGNKSKNRVLEKDVENIKMN